MTELQQSACAMRSMYAREINSAIAAGRVPDQFVLDSWRRYNAAAAAH